MSNGCDIILKNEKLEEISSYMIIEGEYNSKEVATISYKIVKIPYDYRREVENLAKSDMPNKEMAVNELLTGIYVKR